MRFCPSMRISTKSSNTQVQRYSWISEPSINNSLLIKSFNPEKILQTKIGISQFQFFMFRSLWKMDAMWTWKDPRIIRCWKQCTTLLWKAVLMRRSSFIVSILEILIPVIFAIQIRLIFEPLALNIQVQYISYLMGTSKDSFIVQILQFRYK